MFAIEAVRSLPDRVGWGLPPFAYVSRELDLPPLVARAAFDAVRCHHAHPGYPQRWDIQVPAGRLELSRWGRVPPPPRDCYWSFREVIGTICSLWWPMFVPVRLELVPWSDTRTSLGLCVRRPPLLASETIYHQVASQTLDLLRSELHAWGLHQLHDLEAWLRTRGHDAPAE